MARKRLVDPMATVDGVSRRALGVATQAEADAEAAELRRYRDTDEARREAPVVAGSTADGTALQSVIAALTGKGAVVDASETVEDEVTTGSVVADELRVNQMTAETINVSSDLTLTSSDDAGYSAGGSLTVNNFDGTRTFEVKPEGSYISLQTINDRAILGFNGTQLALFASDGWDPEMPTFRVDGNTGNTTIAGDLTVSGTGLTQANIAEALYTVTVGPFWYADLAANVTDGVGQLLVPSNTTPTMILSSATNANRWHVPATGKVVGIAAHGIVTRTAGSATFYPRINNSNTTAKNAGFSVVIGSGQGQNNTTMVGYNSGVSISSGDKLAVSVDTTSTWAPTTGDMQIFLYVAIPVTK